MKKIAFLIAVLQLAMLGALFAAPAAATGGSDTPYGSARTVVSESWVEEWDAASGSWVRVAEELPREERAALPVVTTTYVNGKAVAETRAAARFATPITQRGSARTLAQYGPFVVVSDTQVRMVGATDSSTPRYFDAMMRDFPDLAVLEMVEAPGTTNDIANLAVGRRVRAAGLETYVPRGGSVRSGAVEIFLAGVSRRVDDGAQFAVHSWLDNHGREADDFAPKDPAHRLYLDYYTEMGMSERRAHDFYAMTNSVPHARALWLLADDMRFWLRPEAEQSRVAARSVPAHEEVSDEAHVEVGQVQEGQIALDVLPAPVIAYADLFGLGLAQIQLAAIDTRLDSRAAFP